MGYLGGGFPGMVQAEIMMNGRWLIALACAAQLLAGCAAERGIDELNNRDEIQARPLIPKPLSLDPGDGFFVIDSGTRLVTTNRKVIERGLDQHLRSILDDEISLDPKCEFIAEAVPSSNCILLSMDGESGVLGDEGYELLITPGFMKLSAAGQAGLFYAIQTVGQLLAARPVDPGDRSRSRKIGCCRIVDRPRFPWRGQLLDVSRHFLPLELVKKNIDCLAALKMNVFHWHLTDDQGWRVEIEKIPALTEIGAWRVDRNTEPWWGREPQKAGEKATYGGFYSHEEIREVVEYAARRFVTIVPEIDMPGHSRSTIASCPEISCDNGSYTVATGGIASENTLCPGKEKTFEIVETVLGEVMDLFPSEYIHIGGDECNKSAWKKCPDCRERMETEQLKDELELQSYFIKRLEEIINRRGRKLIGWDEILEGGLAPRAAVMSWRGEQGGIAAASEGHHVVMTPHEYCYLDLKQGDPELEPPLGYAQCTLSKAYSYDPVPEALPPERAGCILGTQGNLWSESIQHEGHAFYMLFPRLYAIAEVGWTPKELRQWDDFIARLEPHLAQLEQREIGFARSIYNVIVEAGAYIEGKGIEIALRTEHGKLPIHYTLDGTRPTPSSPRYKAPLLIDRSIPFSAGSFRAGRLLGKITARDMRIHKGAGKPVRLEAKWSDKYPGGGDQGLTDCRRGSLSYRDGSWMGFEGDDLEAVIDLGSITAVSTVSLGCLESQNSWIFLPQRVEVLLSEKGGNFHPSGSMIHQASRKQAEPRKKTFSVEFPGTGARYVMVRAKNLSRCPEWHPGKEKKSWLFVDEIMVE